MKKGGVMEIKNNQPSFGMVRYGQGVEEHIRKMGHRKAVEFRVIGINNKENPIGIDLSIVKRFGKERLKATVGCKSFVENFLFNPIVTLKRAVSNANRIYAHQQEVKELNAGMVVPRLWN